jgi:hypothetical protein
LEAALKSLPLFSRLPGKWTASDGNEDLLFVNLTLALFALIGILFVWATWWGRASIALLWAGASAAGGFVTGFLFGFPRTIAQPVGGPSSATSPPPVGTQPSADRNRTSRLNVNTNLEQVSDWITKTLVGVGLVQLKQIPGYLVGLANYASGAIGKPSTDSSPGPAAAALITYFAALGFMWGYLVTRMFFQNAFERSDNENRAAANTLRTVVPPPIGDTQASSAKPPAAVIEAAKQIKDVPLSQAAAQGLASVDVARANFYAGPPDKAVTAYLDAVSKDPRNPQLRVEYANALRKAGRDGSEVIAALINARACEADSPSPELRRNIYESLMYMCLYEPAPRGFTNAISYGEEYTQDPGNLPSAVVWVNLACGYGQQARWQHAHQQEIGPVRDEALGAVRQAIQLNPPDKSFLANLLNPTAEQVAQGEDDLAVFRDDAEFRTALGL